MEDKNGRKRLDEHLLAPLAQAGRAELHRLTRGACKCVFNTVHQILLLKRFDVSHQEICVGRMEGKTDLDIELE